nr:nucleotide-binding alpha-beta plait domain-containing protein [Tanacetum cinerariifolium]
MLSIMEGGQEGEQGDSEGDDKREDVSSGNVVNFYFTNFPPEWNKVNLHELFAEIWEIAHVYVARKVRLKLGVSNFEQTLQSMKKNTLKSDQGCKRKGWVFDIPCKLNALPTLDPSSSINETKARNTLDGASFEIDSISELHHTWSSFGATTCKVKYIGGSIFSLEFQKNEEGCNFTRVDYKKSVEQGVEFETGSNHVGDGFDSFRDNVEPLGTTLKCETPNEVVQDGSEEEPSYAACNFPEKDGSVDGGEASPFPAHSHEKDNSNFELGYGSDSYVEKKGQTMAVAMVKEMGTCQVGDVDLSPSYGGEKVGLITPSPSTDVKERCISYYHGFDHVEISDGLNSGSYAIPNQRVN